MRPNDGAHYVINMGGRLDPRLIALVPDFCNVRVRFVDNSTLHSDTCTFQRTLSEIGKAPCHLCPCGKQMLPTSWTCWLNIDGIWASATGACCQQDVAPLVVSVAPKCRCSGPPQVHMSPH